MEGSETNIRRAMNHKDIYNMQMRVSQHFPWVTPTYSKHYGGNWVKVVREITTLLSFTLSRYRFGRILYLFTISLS